MKLTTAPDSNSKRIRIRIEGGDEAAFSTIDAEITRFAVSCQTVTCDGAPYVTGVIRRYDLSRVQAIVSPAAAAESTDACYECGGPVRGGRCARCGERQEDSYSEGGGREIYGGGY